jgi:hypothetical protein
VHAWAVWRVYKMTGQRGKRDRDFLERAFHKLLVNFTWWVNRQDSDGSNVFEGGFLGLDNIGPVDRSHLPQGELLEQSDGTAWMAFYALTMAAIASVLNRNGRPADDLVLKFLEHFASITEALNTKGLWDEREGFFYDQLRLPDGRVIPLEVRSIVGILPLTAVAVVDEDTIRQAQVLNKRAAKLLDIERLESEGIVRGEPGDRRLLLGAVPIDRALRLFSRLFDESAFLSPYGLRALSRIHSEHPFELHVDGVVSTIDYEPAESTTGMFGGNSNWRGPVWFPVNYLVISALRRYGRFFRDEVTIEYPTGSGEHFALADVAADIGERLISLFVVDEDGRRPCFGWVDRLQHDPEWKDNIVFAEYFHGDNGAGLGASHQTGWTGLVADLILRVRGADVPTLSVLLTGSRTRAQV